MFLGAVGLGWVDFSLESFDVAGAHKQVLIREDEQGLCCLVLNNLWYVYRSCFFGAKWSAYWWSRVGPWIVRMLHRFVWTQHGLLLYVDDGLLVVPVAVAPFGIPLSWRKLDLGTELAWIGWRFNLTLRHAFLPLDKAEKCVPGAKVPRKEIEKVIGLLIWFTAGAFWLRPWISSFFNFCGNRQLC